MRFFGTQIRSLDKALRRTHQVRHGRSLALEPLESRHLLSLVGITPQVPLVTFDSSGVITYDAVSQAFRLDATPLVFREATTAPPRAISGTRDFLIQLQVDNSGNLVGGVAGDDFTLLGSIDINGDGAVDASGTLLTGEVSRFGFQEAGVTDVFDFRLTPTGGALASYFVGKDIGIKANSEGSTFADNFAVNFQGGAKGTMGSVAPLLSSLAGNVFSDSNNSGLQEAGEWGIAGTMVGLAGVNVDGVAVDLTTATDSGGTYVFADLRPGTYTITESTPGGYLDGADAVGSQGGTLGNDVLSDITLAAGIAGVENNFGELAPASLAGNIFADADNDGVLESGELGIAGVAVVLTGTDDLGAVSLSTTTDANGAYSFIDLRPGTYVLTESQPAGYLDGTDAVGSQGGTLGNDLLSDLTLAAGIAGVENNFGELAPASLAGFVYLDLDNDAVRQPGDMGLPGVPVTLVGTDDLGAVNLSTTTDSDGAYSFTNLRPGIYVISESQPAGFLDGQDAVGTQGGTLGDDVLSEIALAAGVSGVENNFGEMLLPPALSSLSGYVYVDANDDGIKQAEELGILGVTITLTGADELGTPISLSTTTDADGAYSFMDLTSGAYVITESQPAEYLDGQDAVGTQGGTVGNDVLTDIVLAAGIEGSENNFGELLPASLSGFVYDDANNNGEIDFGELAIANVAVTLSGADDLGNAVSQTALTDVQGAYAFRDLRPGVYAVTEAQPAGYLDGLDTIGTQGGTVGNDQFANITLNQGVVGINNNFAEMSPAGTPLQSGQTATIGFWHNKNGQRLIKSLNGGATATALGNWLAANFNNMYGANAGASNLAGKTNTQIADYFLKLFSVKGQKLDAQALAVALACYVTDADLAGTVATGYGFIVNFSGTAIATYNVGTAGSAFGVANNTTLSILEILHRTNERARNGILWDVDANGTISAAEQVLRTLGNNVFTGINETGDIG